jgi:putative sigma-54 modulation protein
MQVEVRIQGTDLSDAVRTYAVRRMRFVLGRFASRVGRIVIRISDVNGTRGGVDQCCHISAELLPAGKVVLKQLDADLFAAIDRAAERLGQAVRREIQRKREMQARRESVRAQF